MDEFDGRWCGRPYPAIDWDGLCERLVDEPMIDECSPFGVDVLGHDITVATDERLLRRSIANLAKNAAHHAHSRAAAGPRTLTRDLNRLKEAGLIVKHRQGWMSNDSIIRAFLPPMAESHQLA